MSNLKMNSIAQFASVFALLVSSVSFAAPRVELLAETKLNNRTDVDYVPVRSCADAREYVSAVQIVVRGDRADIDSIAVRYGNGEVDNLPVREVFTPGVPSRWIDLRGGKRCVRAVMVVGDSGPRIRRSTVQVFGLIHPIAE